MHKGIKTIFFFFLSPTLTSGICLHTVVGEGRRRKDFLRGLVWAERDMGALYILCILGL